MYGIRTERNGEVEHRRNSSQIQSQFKFLTTRSALACRIAYPRNVGVLYLDRWKQGRSGLRPLRSCVRWNRIGAIAVNCPQTTITAISRQLATIPPTASIPPTIAPVTLFKKDPSASRLTAFPMRPCQIPLRPRRIPLPLPRGTLQGMRPRINRTNMSLAQSPLRRAQSR